MKKKLSEKTVYEPNAAVKLTINNNPAITQEGEILGYERKVTIVIKLGVGEDKLSFADSADIQSFLEGIDLEEPQQRLL